MRNQESVEAVYHILHQMPEPGLAERRTAAYLASRLEQAGYVVRTGVGGTGVIGELRGAKPGVTVMLRADMDCMVHSVDGKEVYVHSCGHDAHSAMVLTTAVEMAAAGVEQGTLKILFQPAEETLQGALGVIADGGLEGVDFLLGLHLRPIQEARLGQATPALRHGASAAVAAALTGKTAHGARPHLGINAIDAGAAVLQAVNAIYVNPAVPATVKATRFQAGGATNAIPDRADLVFDVRAQTNAVMEELLEKTAQAVAKGAASIGAAGEALVAGRVPAAEYDAALTALLAESIRTVLGETGLLAPIQTPGGEDFHFYRQHRPALRVAYFGLGADLTPGLHHPDMTFDLRALRQGVDILLRALEHLLGKGGEA
ncbi:MAG: amidohydrolase [Sporomusaceae bacterium]|nr:amidohydrolase [Sporomusaceae bacterium]